jgi:lipoprotein NlpI
VPADFAQTVGGWKEGWTKTIGQFLTGQRDEAALLAAAEKSDQEPVAGQRCEAWYFAGQMRLLKGDQAGAREAFQKALATNQTNYNEYLFAQAALARLAAAGKQ